MQKNELANKLIDGLNNLISSLEEGSAERWIWELIQNAKDSSITHEDVKIEIVITDEYIEFKHSGRPFTEDDLLSLVCQTSAKERPDDP